MTLAGTIRPPADCSLIEAEDWAEDCEVEDEDRYSRIKQAKTEERIKFQGKYILILPKAHSKEENFDNFLE